MGTLRTWWMRLADGLFRRSREARLSDEIEAHLDQLTDEHVARGLPLADARLAARKAFGGVDQVKEAYRDQRGLSILDALAQDLRFAFRLFSRDRGFAAAAVLVLGIGIGVSQMFFTIVYSHTLRGMPIPGVDRVLFVQTVDSRGAIRGLSHPEMEDLRAAATAFAGIAAFAGTSVSLGDPGRAPDRFAGAYVSANGFGLVGASPLRGRAFAAGDDRPGAEPVIMLGEGAWRSRYGGSEEAIGRRVLFNGVPATVIGIMSDRSGFPSLAEVWAPMATMPGVADQRRDARRLSVFGRVRDDWSAAEAGVEVSAWFDRMSSEYPDTTGVRARVMPINDVYFGQLTHPAWLAFTTAGLLIGLIACANVANLMLSRAVHRAREIAIRTSLGASRRRVVRQLLIESAVLAACGGVVGLGVSEAAIRIYSSFVPLASLGYWLHYSIDLNILAGLALVSAATVFVFGLVPALHASKTDVTAVLKDGGRARGASRGARRWAMAFMTAELALTVVLLANQSMSVRDRFARSPADRAVDTHAVLTATLTLPGEKYAAPDQREAFHRRLIERLAALPGVPAASLASHLPMSGGLARELDSEGRALAAGESRPTVISVSIAPRHFDTLGLGLVRGRDFDDDDGGPGRASAIVNERLARMVFPDRDPVGQRVALRVPGAAAGEPAWLTIVGVAPSIRQSTNVVQDPLVYVPLRSAPPATVSLLLRSQVDSGALTSTVRDAVLALDPSLPVYRSRTLAQFIREETWNTRVSTGLVLMLTILALTLSTVGLYAITAHAVGQRTPELGLRMALGAKPGQIRRLVLKTAAVQLLLGLAAGVLCTIAWDRLFVAADAPTRIMEPGTLAGVAVMLATVLAVACLAPARRATRLDPAAALRDS